MAKKKVRVALIGVGNCASSLVQGVHYYRNAKSGDKIPGLMHVDLGGYHINDIEFTAAFDINKTKVGLDISEAIFSEPNNTTVFQREIPKLNAKVYRGMTHDGMGKYLKEVIEKAPGPTDDITGILKETKTDIVVNYLPVGSETATKWYVEHILSAGCALVNAIPVFIASTPYWQNRFRDAGLPVLGDDIKSQVGATILHRVLTNLFLDRGMAIDKSYQLNVGGNTDFLNMLERERLQSKKISKTNAVVSQIENRGEKIADDDIYVGPSDYVPWMKDNKVCFLRIQSKHFGDVPMELECRLSVEDSPNSAGIIIDAVRFAKLALDNCLSGQIDAPSSYLFKSPPIQYTDDHARNLCAEYIEKYGKKDSGKEKA
ncbi:MAG: inositol-3-phosphate synthase [Candidatus Zixiibacteriota bacterium]